MLWLTINRSNDATAGEAPLPDPLGYALAPLRPLAGLVDPRPLEGLTERRAEIAREIDQLERLAATLEGLARLKRRSAGSDP